MDPDGHGTLWTVITVSEVYGNIMETDTLNTLEGFLFH